MGPTETLARFTVETRYEDIPQDVVERAKELVTNMVERIEELLGIAGLLDALNL